MARYRVELHSTPAPGLVYYTVSEMVVANSNDEAVLAAKTQLKRGAFIDRSFNSWVVDHIEEVL